MRLMSMLLFLARVIAGKAILQLKHSKSYEKLCNPTESTPLLNLH